MNSPPVSINLMHSSTKKKLTKAFDAIICLTDFLFRNIELRAQKKLTKAFDAIICIIRFSIQKC